MSTLFGKNMLLGQNRFGTIFGQHHPLIFLVNFSGDWDVHWGYGLLTHGHMLLGEKCGKGSAGHFCPLETVGVLHISCALESLPDSGSWL